jgi:NAD(P)-dependent dehydrogenase (short-subunit alcohol dehydrogenase family)
MDRFSLAGKTAAVTAACRGWARPSLSDGRGGRKCCACRFAGTEGQHRLAAIEKFGSKALFVKTDVTKEQQVTNFVDKTVRNSARSIYGDCRRGGE